MGSESRDERLKKFEKSQIKTPQLQTEALQKAQAEIGSLTNERLALLRQQLAALAGYQLLLGLLLGQATALSAATAQLPLINVALLTRAMNALTLAILLKYGVNPRKPQAAGSKTIQQKPVFRSAVSGAGTTNIRTENKTIYNTKTTNSVLVVLPQGNSQITIRLPRIQVAQPAIQLRNLLSLLIQAQNQQYELTKKNYLRSDISLRKGADMMMRKIDAASKRFAENMNPQKLAASSIDSTKVIMMLAVTYLGIKFIGPISRRIDKLYCWFTGETPEGGQLGSEGYNEHMGFFDRLKAMIDTKKDDSLVSKIVNIFKDGFEEIKSNLELFFLDRARAIAAVKGPNDRDEGWFDISGFGLKYLPAYIADVFRAMVGGTLGLAKAETREQTKKIEKEGREEMLKNQGLPEESIFNGTEKSGITAMGTKVGIWGDQYMIPATKGGVVKNRDGSYSIAQVQSLHDIVRKNASNPLGGGSSIVTTDYAYLLGGDKVNVFEDERTKKYVTRVGKLKKLSLLPFKKAVREHNIKSGGLHKEPEEFKKYYNDLYESLVKLLDSKVDYDKGWYKEIKTYELPGGNGKVTMDYEVYHFPESEEVYVKSSIENLINAIKNKHLSKKNLTVGKINSNFEESEMDLTKVDKELFNVLKEIYDIKEYNTADKNANSYFESMIGANYKTSGEDELGNATKRLVDTTEKKITDKEAIEEALKPVEVYGNYETEKEILDMYNEQHLSLAYKNFKNKVKGVVSDVSKAVVDFRTDDNIEKSAKSLNNVVEYLSKSLEIPKDAAIGIVSNLWGESKVNPLGLGDDNSSLGIAQWHYKKGIQEIIDNVEKVSGIKLKTREDGDLIRIDSKDQSWVKLQKFAEDNLNYLALLTNLLDILTKLLKEAGPSSSYGKLYEQLRRSNNPISAEDAAQKFVELFEMPLHPKEDIRKRRDYASQIKRYLDQNFQLKEEPLKESEDYWREHNSESAITATEDFSEKVTEYTVAASEKVKSEPPKATLVEEAPKAPATEAPSDSNNLLQNVNLVHEGDNTNNISMVNYQSSEEYNPVSN